MATELTDAARALLDMPLYGTIATVNSAGAPIQALVWYMRQGAEIIVHTSADAVKTRNIRQHPWASLSVSEGPRYVSVRGRARIETDEATVRRTFRQIIERYVPPAQVEGWMTRMGANAGISIYIPIEQVIGSF